MVLLLKQWKSRSSPGFAGGVRGKPIHDVENAAFETISEAAFLFERVSASDVGAGWSSPVARQAHNLKVAGSNPAPATNVKSLASNSELGICVAPDWIRGPPFS